MRTDKKQGRPLDQGGPKVTDALNDVDASTIADRHVCVFDLAAERRRRLVRDLHLGPTAPEPCSGECDCWGAPLGGCGA